MCFSSSFLLFNCFVMGEKRIINFFITQPEEYVKFVESINVWSLSIKIEKFLF